jgi:tripartite-type tricarboxylate transporter receptor subunit TctC
VEEAVPFRVPLLALIGGLVAGGILLGLGDRAHAQPDSDFKGKTVTVYIGFGSGGGYDQYARLFARHVGRHIPGNPTIVPSNMLGANGIVAANYLYTSAARDGTAIGFLYQAIAQDQVLLQTNVQYDATKFNWIGRITSTAEIMYTWHRAPVQKVADLATRETVFGVAGPLIITYTRLLNSSIGARFKIVRGYKSTAEIHIAMERGEVEGAYSSLSTVRSGWNQWLTDKQINILVQMVPERHPDLADVPTIVELGKTAEDRAVMSFFAASGAVGRSIVAPPGVPPDRLEILRTAFHATMRDPQFLAEARQMKLDVEPLPGGELAKLAARVVGIGAAERERAQAMAK